jgi:hypothetical protein
MCNLTNLIDFEIVNINLFIKIKLLEFDSGSE